MPTRTEIVAKAREYVGTPFQHQGRLKGKALDCVGLVLCVGEELGIVGIDGKPICAADYAVYGPQPAGTFVHDECRKRLVMKLSFDICPGDVLSLRVPVEPVHVAIVTAYGGELYIVHAYSGWPEKCVETILDIPWRRRIVGVFEFPGVTD